MANRTERRSLVGSLPALATLLVSVGLLVAAFVRWPQIHWGGQVWLLVMLATFAVRAPFSAQVRKNVIAERRHDRVEATLLTAMFAGMMVLPMIAVATPVLSFADYRLPDWATTAGVLLNIPYIWLFWRSHTDLGRNWSPGLEVRDGHSLVTRGVYGPIRHPMYAAIWIGVVAQPLVVQNWIGGCLALPAFAALYLTRIPKEEAMMRAQFGADYDAYAAKTGRIWPRFRRDRRSAA